MKSLDILPKIELVVKSGEVLGGGGAEAGAEAVNVVGYKTVVLHEFDSRCSCHRKGFDSKEKKKRIVCKKKKKKKESSSNMEDLS
jgi:hypothetical protein